MRGGAREEELSVFEFDAEEEAVEVAAEKYAALFRTLQPPAVRRSAAVSSGPSDTDVGDMGHTCNDLSEEVVPPNSDAARMVSPGKKDEAGRVSVCSGSYPEQEHVSCGDISQEHAICKDDQDDDLMRKNPCEMQAYCFHEGSTSQQFIEFQLNDMAVDSVSEDDDSSMASKPSSTTNPDDSDEDYYLEQSMLNFDSAVLEVENEGSVVLRPDFVLFNELVYLEPQITFLPDKIIVEICTNDIDDEKIVTEWGIPEVEFIDCFHVKDIDAVSLRFISRVNVENEYGKTGRSIIEFSITGIAWANKEKNIKSLAPRYRDLWNINALNLDLWRDGGSKLDLSVPTHYFTVVLEPFEVIYPKGDQDAITVSDRDAELLMPETYVNDTLIDFYIKYLNNKLEPTGRQRFHFFNSFFFRKLVDFDKDQGKAPEGRASFLRVRKWTRKVNIFEKDYIFIPVNFNLHWSLLVICHPGEIKNFDDEDAMDSAKVPCILHMDSLKGNHSGVKDVIQSYLWEEWKERNPESTLDNSTKFMNLRFISLELPQQENSYDCGLFLLHYVELFLEDAPRHFNPFKIKDYSSFLTPEWFPPADASFKRTFIRKLIFDLLKEPSEDPCRHPERDDGAKPETVSEFLPECCVPPGHVSDLIPLEFDDGRMETNESVACAADVSNQEAGSVPQNHDNEVLPLFPNPNDLELQEPETSDKLPSTSTSVGTQGTNPCITAPYSEKSQSPEDTMDEKHVHKDSPLASLIVSSEKSNQTVEAKQHESTAFLDTSCAVPENIISDVLEENLNVEEESPKNCRVNRESDDMVGPIQSEATQTDLMKNDSRETTTGDCKCDDNSCLVTTDDCQPDGVMIVGTEMFSSGVQGYDHGISADGGAIACEGVCDPSATSPAPSDVFQVQDVLVPVIEDSSHNLDSKATNDSIAVQCSDNCLSDVIILESSTKTEAATDNTEMGSSNDVSCSDAKSSRENAVPAKVHDDPITQQVRPKRRKVASAEGVWARTRSSARGSR